MTTEYNDYQDQLAFESTIKLTDEEACELISALAYQEPEAHRGIFLKPVTSRAQTTRQLQSACHNAKPGSLLKYACQSALYLRA